MSIVLCTDLSDPSPFLARCATCPSLYLRWGPPASTHHSAALSEKALPSNWETCDISIAPPSPQSVARAELIVSGIAPEAWTESNGVATGEILRSATPAAATLLLLGPSIGVAGDWRADGSPGLGIIPGTVILHDLQAVPDLRKLIVSLSVGQARLLALDGPVCIEYDPAADCVTASGGGSALLATFIHDAAGGQPSVRLHLLSAGSSSGWPA